MTTDVEEFPSDIHILLKELSPLPPVLHDLICEFFSCQCIRYRNGFAMRKYCKECKRAHQQENGDRWPRRNCKKHIKKKEWEKKVSQHYQNRVAGGLLPQMP